MAKRQKKHPTPGDAMVILGIAGLMGMAIRKQLQMPLEERIWHGTLYGIPYDFRRPTIERLREAFWNKDTARVLVPQFFGMGWSINFYPLINPPKEDYQRRKKHSVNQRSTPIYNPLPISLSGASSKTTSIVLTRNAIIVIDTICDISRMQNEF